ncbi:MAG: hypothetical protein ACPGIJ_02875 [Mycobacterium sp.]
MDGIGGTWVKVCGPDPPESSTVVIGLGPEVLVGVVSAPGEVVSVGLVVVVLLLVVVLSDSPV